MGRGGGTLGSNRGIATEGTVDRTDQLVRVVGEFGYELATEVGSMTLAGTSIEEEYRATTVYRLEDGEWKIVHHHTDVSDEMIEVLETLDGEA